MGAHGSLRGLKRIAATLCLLAAACAPAFAIEEESAAAFFRADRERLQQSQRPAPIKQRPTHLIRRAAPVRGFTVEQPAPEPPAPPTPDESGAQTADAPAAPMAPAADDRLAAQRPADALFRALPSSAPCPLPPPCFLPRPAFFRALPSSSP